MNSKNNNNKKNFFTETTENLRLTVLVVVVFFLSELTNVLHQCENLHCVNYRTGVITAREEKLKQLRSCVSVGIATECMNTLKTGCPASESDSTPPAYLQLHSRHSSHSQVCPEALSHAV